MPTDRDAFLCLRCPLATCDDEHPGCLIAARRRAQKRAWWHRRKDQARAARSAPTRAASHDTRHGALPRRDRPDPPLGFTLRTATGE